MKTLILAIALTISAPAFARDIVSLDCVSRPNSFTNITLQVKSFWSSEDQKSATMRDVTLVRKDEQNTNTGRAQTLESDASYNGRKYKNHLRFKMYQLTDTETFGAFYPDMCDINVMVPADLVTANGSTVELPVVMQCDQSGGSQTLDCKVGNVR